MLLEYLKENFHSKNDYYEEEVMYRLVIMIVVGELQQR
jgi:hypothetical protein